jgi:PKD repeat protein
MELRFDASSSIGAVDKYEWDLDGDGTYDATTAEPVFRHTYANEFEGEMILRVSNIVGSSHVLRTPVHVSTKPYHQRLAPPTNVQVEVLSTSNGISEIKVTWESDDRAADSWA